MDGIGERIDATPNAEQNAEWQDGALEVNALPDEAKQKSNIAVTFAFRRNRLRIYKAVLEALHRPAYIQLLIHTKTNHLYIRGCGMSDRDRLQVPSDLFQNPDAAYELTSKLFMTAILKQTGWDARYSYRAGGQYYEDLNAVGFDLNSVEKIEKDEKSKGDSTSGLS